MSPKKPRTALFDAPVPADDVVVRCVRLGDVLSNRLSLFFKEHGLTILQYTVLRILYVRDPDGEGLSSGEIGGRLLVRVPDVTRLIDRMVSAGLVERFRSPDDRRVVKVRLTQAATDLVEAIHQPLIQHNVEMFAGMPEKDLERLSSLLARAHEALTEKP